MHHKFLLKIYNNSPVHISHQDTSYDPGHNIADSGVNEWPA